MMASSSAFYFRPPDYLDPACQINIWMKPGGRLSREEVWREWDALVALREELSRVFRGASGRVIATVIRGKTYP